MGRYEWLMAVPLSVATAATLTRPDQNNDYAQREDYRVAIIGAGIAGATAAHHVHKLNLTSQPTSITIFEQGDRVGGRIHSFQPDTAFHRTLEAGATEFSSDDTCIISAAHDLGLTVYESEDYTSSHIPASVFAQHGLQVKEINCNVESPTYEDVLLHVRKWVWALVHLRKPNHHFSKYWKTPSHVDLIRAVWRYGSSVLTVRDLVSSTAWKWRSFADAEPFDNIGEELRRIGLFDYDLTPASGLYDNLSVPDGLRNEVLQPCSIGLNHRTLEEAAALASLLSLRKIHRSFLYRGNIQLVDRLLQASNATVRLQRKVTAISPGSERRYRLTHLSAAGAAQPSEEHSEFDAVIIATPLSINDLDLSQLNLPASWSPAATFNEAHITHFTSTAPLAANMTAMNVSISAHSILTTSAPTNATKILSIHQSEACYRRIPCFWDDECDQCEDENLFRVYSRHRLSDGEVLKLINHAQKEGSREEGDLPGISWIHRYAWPRAFSGRTKDVANVSLQVEVAPGLYYLGGAEEVVAGMEMSCRMGRNAARLLGRVGGSDSGGRRLEHSHEL
jgi:hypothetical protein